MLYIHLYKADSKGEVIMAQFWYQKDDIASFRPSRKPLLPGGVGAAGQGDCRGTQLLKRWTWREREVGERDDGPSKVKDNELTIPVNPTEIYWLQIVRGFN